MRHPIRKTSLVLAVLGGLAAALFGGCGEKQLPDDVAAKVRDRVITKAAVRRAVVGQIAMKHSAKTMPPYLPTDAEACVATLGKRPIAGNPSRAELRQRCEGERDRLEAAALRFLIKGEWYRLDRKRRGASIPTGRSTARWASAHAGVGVENLRGVAGIYLLKIGIAQRIVPRLQSPSEAEIARQYRTHQKRYVEAVKRFGPVLIVPTRTEADTVALLLQSGQSQERIARAKAGKVTILYGEKTIFPVEGAEIREGSTARVGEIGIVKDERGWIVYRLRDLLPLKEQYSLTAVRNRVKSDIEKRNLRAGTAAYDARLRSDYQEDTTCADDHHVPECK